ncbi:hypothetical protein L226DRAFT_571708 [Lentinus tigrinus ALCF2SS1-7]|uniref:uncharacterized protein n=1 Tax=Lentinus tigrinus ALCF2SS1-7 TaxID=1328758 RepID=UPI0011661D18|nr:hypothetical protein L226DRAFT_571708 [Lentinus tigrinus ALCF2SS1-7]
MAAANTLSGSRILFVDYHAKWAQDPHGEGPGSPRLTWTEAQVALAEVSPRIYGLVVADAVREGPMHVRVPDAGGVVTKNVLSSGLTMDTTERMYVATFTETGNNALQIPRFHIRFDSLIEWLQFTRAFQDAKIKAESLSQRHPDAVERSKDAPAQASSSKAPATPKRPHFAMPVTPPPTGPKKDVRTRSVPVRTTTPVGSPSLGKDPMFAERPSGNAPVSGPSQTKGKGKSPVQLREASPAAPYATSAARARSTPPAFPSPLSRATSPASSSASASSSAVDRVPTPDWLKDFEYDINNFEEYVEEEDVEVGPAKDQNDNKDDEDGMEVDSTLIKRTTKTRTAKDKLITMAWFYTEGQERIAAPPASTSLEQTPQIGDIFFHSVTSQTPPDRQFFLRIMGVDGRQGWWPIDHGYRRADGYVLSVTPKTNEPSWVKDGQYKSNLRVERTMAATRSRASTLRKRIPSITSR